MPRLRSVFLACGLVAAITGASTAGAAQRAPKASAAPDPEGSAGIVRLGHARPLRTTNGRIVAVTVLGVHFRHRNYRFVDVHLRYALRRGALYRLDPVREAQLLDGSGNHVVALAGGTAKPLLKHSTLRRGHPRTGWVTFTLPTASGATRVLVTLDSGMGPTTGQWRIPARA
jgi:hypothetical protein